MAIPVASGHRLNIQHHNQKRMVVAVALGSPMAKKRSRVRRVLDRPAIGFVFTNGWMSRVF
jgi:hypothetical protein